MIWTRILKWVWRYVAFWCMERLPGMTWKSIVSDLNAVKSLSKHSWVIFSRVTKHKNANRGTTAQKRWNHLRRTDKKRFITVAFSLLYVSKLKLLGSFGWLFSTYTYSDQVTRFWNKKSQAIFLHLRQYLTLTSSSHYIMISVLLSWISTLHKFSAVC